jgi:hypothetical protein
MSSEFQYISIKLLIKVFFLFFLVLFAFHFKKDAKRLTAFIWLNTASVFIHILTYIPLPFQMDAVGFPFMSTHILGLMTINFMTLLSIQYMPYDAPDRFVKAMKGTKSNTVIVSSFILLASFIIVVTGFGIFVDPEKMYYVFICMDAVTTTIVLLFWSYYFYRSFLGVVLLKGVQHYLLAFLVAQMLFYVVFFLKSTLILDLEESEWYRILSLVLYVVQAFFTLIYLAALALSQQGSTKHTSDVAVTDIELAQVKSIEKILMELKSNRYVLSLTFSFADGTYKSEELILQRPLKPFAYWLQFALAGQNEIWLTHSEISVIKYRMVEFWNKSMTTKINQELLFKVSRIEYALQLEPKNITIDFDLQLKDYSLYESTFKEFYSDFLPWLKENHSNGTQKWTPQSSFLALVTGFK